MPSYLRSLFLTTGIYSLLAWVYVCLRLIIDKISAFDRFIDWIPISFYELGIVTFLISFVSMFLYLAFWGFSRSTHLRYQ